MVAPAIAYGYKSQQKSGGGDHLVGTTSLSGASLTAQAPDLVKSYLRQGFRHLVFVNGHYENYQFLYEGIDLALEECGIGPDADRSVLLLSYGLRHRRDPREGLPAKGFPGWEIEHGGVLETSLMLHLRPARVDLTRSPSGPPARLPRFDRLPVVASRTPESGCLSSPQGADAAKGRLLYEQVVAAIAADTAAELSLPDASAVTPRRRRRPTP